jgi:hypothetical protein
MGGYMGMTNKKLMIAGVLAGSVLAGGCATAPPPPPKYNVLVEQWTCYDKGTCLTRRVEKSYNGLRANSDLIADYEARMFEDSLLLRACKLGHSGTIEMTRNIDWISFDPEKQAYKTQIVYGSTISQPLEQACSLEMLPPGVTNAKIQDKK